MIELLRKTKIFFYYVFYAMLTQSERLRYLHGQNRGCYVSEVKSDMFGTDITYHPGKPNVREYLNWKEFKERHNWDNKPMPPKSKEPLFIDPAKPLFIIETSFDYTYHHYDGKYVTSKEYKKPNHITGSPGDQRPLLKYPCNSYLLLTLSDRDFESLFATENIMKLWRERYEN